VGMKSGYPNSAGMLFQLLFPRLQIVLPEGPHSGRAALVHGCGLTRLGDPIQPSTLGTGYENHYSVSCSLLVGGVLGRWMRRQQS
jgi:hypothetical protein